MSLKSQHVCVLWALTVHWITRLHYKVGGSIKTFLNRQSWWVVFWIGLPFKHQPSEINSVLRKGPIISLITATRSDHQREAREGISETPNFASVVQKCGFFIGLHKNTSIINKKKQLFKQHRSSPPTSSRELEDGAISFIQTFLWTLPSTEPQVITVDRLKRSIGKNLVAHLLHE